MTTPQGKQGEEDIHLLNTDTANFSQFFVNKLFWSSGLVVNTKRKPLVMPSNQSEKPEIKMISDLSSSKNASLHIQKKNQKSNFLYISLHLPNYFEHICTCPPKSSHFIFLPDPIKRRLWLKCAKRLTFFPNTSV